MEYWVRKADDVLILIYGQRYLYKNRSHSVKPIIPTFQYSNTSWHSISAIPAAGLVWLNGPDFRC